MKSHNPLFSTASLLFTLVLFGGLGVWAVINRGVIFSPGDLSAMRDPGVNLGGFDSHAEFEIECSRCHQPLNGPQSEQCLQCHTDVKHQITANTSLHSTITNVDQCYYCHSDHQGRNFDLNIEAALKFDHTVTQFNLIWHQIDYDATPMACKSCHTAGNYLADQQTCIDCHGARDSGFMQKHIDDFSQECLNCHDGQDRMTRFDHNQSSFPLKGEHQSVACASCHLDGQFVGLPLNCSDCHQEPEVHADVFTQECAECHNEDAWKPARLDNELFDHEENTNFSLVRHRAYFDGTVITCLECHQPDTLDFSMQSCFDCHADQNLEFMLSHQEQVGTNCLQCHDGIDRMKGFDHNQVFVLDGRHIDVECEACHANNIFHGTPRECVQCHAEPEIHAGFFGLSCQYCHTTSSWSPAALRIHIFPLDHGDKGEIDCQTCHVSTYAEISCYGCHDHQPVAIADTHTKAGISLVELKNCAKCHPFGEIEMDRPQGDSDS